MAALAPRKLATVEVDALIAARTPSAGLDASGFIRALMVEQRQTGNRIRDAITAPAVHAEVVKLYRQLQQNAGVTP